MMLTTEEKMKLVETGINEFAVNPKFKELLIWLCEEFDNAYEKKMAMFFDPPHIKMASKGKAKLRVK